ncbi:hypothetical protein Anapl_13614 [Anas platyrhynchos]|uniref:Uncharacterized protein n=1 Tax=Anas platyrhynchos TaxID=8839 RepID=R0LSU5_ANAPL|nr:hypothetical protein Anapl_13614 [Anas platyrhynchos]
MEEKTLQPDLQYLLPEKTGSVKTAKVKVISPSVQQLTSLTHKGAEPAKFSTEVEGGNYSREGQAHQKYIAPPLPSCTLLGYAAGRGRQWRQRYNANHKASNFQCSCGYFGFLSREQAFFARSSSPAEGGGQVPRHRCHTVPAAPLPLSRAVGSKSGRPPGKEGSMFAKRSPSTQRTAVLSWGLRTANSSQPGVPARCRSARGQRGFASAAPPGVMCRKGRQKLRKKVLANAEYFSNEGDWAEGCEKVNGVCKYDSSQLVTPSYTVQVILIYFLCVTVSLKIRPFTQVYKVEELPAVPAMISSSEVKGTAEIKLVPGLFNMQYLQCSEPAYLTPSLVLLISVSSRYCHLSVGATLS